VIESTSTSKDFIFLGQHDEFNHTDNKMIKKSFPLSKVYCLLEPGPVVMVTTAWLERQNMMTMSWYTMLEFEPPLIGCVINNRDFTFSMLEASKECVIAIPTVELAAQVMRAGNTSGRDIDKFATFALTAIPATRVKAPLIAECYANLECKVTDTAMVSKYNFFVLQVVRAWINPEIKHPRTIHHQGKGVFMVSGKTIKLPSKMK
jgi:flavin reductase (DIM6/NTAB) family NADH-FMN oxidoreductase RutF